MMRKTKLLTGVFLVVGIAALASAGEVISIDINNYGNDVAYSGQAAVSGATEWVVYYGGWGKPAGSPRSSNLAEARTYDPENNDPYPGSIYAEQVWLGDYGGHDYITGAGGGLLDDGFVKAAVGGDPNIVFIGSDIFSGIGDHAYGGTFDMYVYGNSAGDFYLTTAPADPNSDPNDLYIIASGSVTGTTSGFVEGENYVVFENIPIARPDSVRLWYTNELNAIQLVSTKQTPKQIINSGDPNDYTLTASEWDVAYDKNDREGEATFYGPDTFGPEVGYNSPDEYMEYDIAVDAAGQGQYDLTIAMYDPWGATGVDIYLDGVLLGSLAESTADWEVTGPLTINLFEGTHTIKWVFLSGYGNISDMVFNFVGPITLNTCEDVYTYGLQPAGDINRDCRVNMDDLILIAAEWASDYNPF